MMHVRSKPLEFRPNPTYVATEVPHCPSGHPDPTAATEEQRLLATIHDSRLLDVFTGLTCYSLQTSVRTDVSGLGQVATDEVYIGAEGDQVRSVLPVQARASGRAFDVVRVGQDVAMCAARFPDLVPHAIGAQFMEPDLIALLAFVDTDDGIRVDTERHYRLVAPDQLSAEELASYRSRPA